MSPRWDGLRNSRRGKDDGVGLSVGPSSATEPGVRMLTAPALRKPGMSLLALASLLDFPRDLP